MKQFAKNLRSEWRKLNLPVAEKTIVVAVSGGADSVSLLGALHELQLLNKLKLEVVVAHFNHQLRGAESDADAEFVKSLAAKFDFQFAIQNSQSKIQNVKGDLEQAARRARYDFLLETARKHSAFAVFTGHTLDDQAETFLLRLIRGSGADGLSAMKTVRLLNAAESDVLLIRPLLSWARRAATEDFCRAVGIEPRSDSMNESLRFARVRVRQELIPLLKTFNPQIVETLTQTAHLLREDAEELNAQTEQLLMKNENLLLVAQCSPLSASLRRRVLRRWLERERGDLRRITAKHLQAIESLVTGNEGGRTIELPGGAIVLRQRNQLIFVNKVEKSSGGN